MLLLFFSGLVVSPVIDLEVTDYPCILYRTIVTIDNIASTTADANFPVSNLANPATDLRWQGTTTADHYITITTGTADAIDAIGVARHNWGSAGWTVSVEGDDGSGYAEIVVPFIPGDDSPLLMRFDTTSYSAVRIKLTGGSEVPRAAVVYLGKLLVLPVRIYDGHTPINDGLKSKSTNGRSESGEILGRIITTEWNENVWSLTLIDPTFYREQMREFVLDYKDEPFFSAWRSLTYPREAGYCILTADPKPTNAAPSKLVAIDFAMSGVV